MPEEKNPKFISLQEAAKISSYSQERLSLHARQGKLKALKIGRNWVTTKEWLQEYCSAAQFISLQDAARSSPYSQEYLSLRARQGKLKALKIGRNWVTTKEWISQYTAGLGELKKEIAPYSKFVAPPENLPMEISPPFRPAPTLNFLRQIALAGAFLFLIAAGIAFGKDGFEQFARTLNKEVQQFAIGFDYATQSPAALSNFMLEGYMTLNNWVDEGLRHDFRAIASLFQKPEAPVAQNPPAPPQPEVKQAPPAAAPPAVPQPSPVREVVRQQVVTVDNTALRELRLQVLGVLSLAGDVERLKEVTAKIQAGPPNSVVSVAPLYIGSTGLQVGGAGLFNSVGGSSAGFTNLGVGGSATIGSPSDSSSKFTVASTSTFTGPVYLNSSFNVGTAALTALTVNTAGNLSTTGTIAIKDANGNAKTTLDANGNLTMAGALVVTGGSSISGGTTTLSDLNVTGNATLGSSSSNNVTFNASTLAVPNNLNIASNTLFIDSANGRVGIGTSSPQTKFHVALSDSATNAMSNVFTIDHTSTGTPAAGFGSAILFRLANASGALNNAASINAILSGTTSGSEASAITFNVGAAGAEPSEKLRLGSTGELSITGAVTASSDLVVLGNTAFGASTTNYTNFYGSQINIPNNVGFLQGNLGIGTVSPNNRLEVLSTSTPQLRVAYDTSNYFTQAASSTGAVTFAATGSGAGFTFSNPITASSTLSVTGAVSASSDVVATANAAFGTTSSNLINIYGSQINIPNNVGFIQGNVGIGTTSPAALFSVGSSSQFQVNSSGAIAAVTGITTSGPYTQTGTSANAFTGTATFSNATYSALFTGGNVGIGTATPNNKLEVLSTTTPQLRVAYDTSNYFTQAASSTGAVTFAATGTGAGFTFSNALTASSTLSVTGGVTASSDLAVLGNTTLNGSLTVSGITITNGNVVLGNTAANTIQFVGVVNSDITPDATNTRNFGSSSKRWATGYFTTVDATTLSGTVSGGSTSSASWTINSGNATNNAQISSLAFSVGTAPINAAMQWNAANDAARYSGYDNNLVFNYPVSIISQVSGGNQTFTSGKLFNYSQSATHAITQSGAFTGLNVDFSSNITVPNSSSGNQTGVLVTLKDGGASATSVGYQTAGTLDYGLDIGGTIGTADIRLSNAATIANTTAGAVTFAGASNGFTFSNPVIASSTLSVTGATTMSSDLVATANAAFGTSSTNYLNVYGNQINIPNNLGFMQGNVGIGTTSPAKKLDIVGDLNVAPSSGNAEINIKAAGFGNQRIRAAGNNLEIVQSTDGTGNFIFRDSGGIAVAQFVYGSTSFQPLTDDAGSLGTTSNRWNSLRVGTGTSSFAGNVGIGTASPNNKLEVLSVTTPQLRVAYDTSNYYTHSVSSTGAVTFAATGTGAGFTFSNPITASSTFSVTGAVTASSDVVATANAAFGTSSTNYMNFYGSQINIPNNLGFIGGNVGIGTTSPAALFSVGSSSQFQVNSSGAIAAVTGITNSGAYTQTGTSANAFTGTATFSNATYSALFTGGNVGIGTATPNNKLEVLSTTTPQLRVAYDTNNYFTQAASSTGAVTFAATGTGAGFTFSNPITASSTLSVTGATSMSSDLVATANAAFGTSSTNYMNFYGSQINIPNNLGFIGGNVGIGTTSPAALFSVGSSSQFQVSSTGAVTMVGVNSGTGLIQGTGGLTVTGTTNINATGTSATTIGNSTGALTLASGGTSGWTNTAGNLTIQTATSGTLALTSAGALNLTSTSANLALQTTTSGNITLAPASTGSVQITSGVTTGTTTSSGLSLSANSLQSGYAQYITSTSTAGTASGSSYLLYLDRNGANANTAHTAYGVYATVTNTNATSGTNIAGYFSASGAATANYGLIVAAGRAGIGTSSPNNQLEVLSTTTPQLRVAYDTSNYYTHSVSSTGAVTFAATGTGAGFTFSNPLTASSTLSVTGAVSASSDVVATANAALGTSSANYLNIYGNQINIPNNVGFVQGNVGIGTTNPAVSLQVVGGIMPSTSGAGSGFFLAGNARYGRIVNDVVTSDYWSLGYSSTTGGAVTDVLTWNSSGNVGIGITPTTLLHLSASTPKITVADTGGSTETTTLRAGAAISNAIAGFQIIPTLGFSVSTGAQANKFVIDTSGNVGIGTTNPARLFTVDSTGAGFNTRVLLQNDQTAATDVGGAVEFRAGGAAVTQALVAQGLEGASTSNSYLAFYTRGSDTNAERVRITSTGNVGIGTSSPGALLDVRASVTGDMVRMGGGTITATGGNARILNFSNNATTFTAAANSDILSAFMIRAGTNFTFATGTFTGLSAFALDLGSASWAKTGTGTIDNTAVIHIANVGTIGTNNYAILVEGGNSKFSGNILTSDTNAIISSDSADGSDNKRIFLAGAGGDTGGVGSTRGALVIVYGNEYGSSLGGQIVMSAGSGPASPATGEGDIIFNTNSNERMRIQRGGNVGIAATAPNLAGSYGSTHRFLTIDGGSGSGIGILELATVAADAASQQVGAVDFTMPANNSGYGLIAEITALTATGGGANQRGGDILFKTQPNGSAGIVERMRITSVGRLIVPTATSHLIGGSTINDNDYLEVTGSYTSGASGVMGLQFHPTLTPVAAGGVYGIVIGPTLVEYSLGTHSNLINAYFAPTITAGGANVTQASNLYLDTFAAQATTTTAVNLYIANAPTGGGTNYALWVAGGTSIFGGSVGIGVTGPTHALEVSGQIYATDNISTVGVIIGLNGSPGSLRLRPSGSTGAVIMQNSIGTHDEMTVTSNGGVQVYGPTGGDKGEGTINVSSAYYRNGDNITTFNRFTGSGTWTKPNGVSTVIVECYGGGGGGSSSGGGGGGGAVVRRVFSAGDLGSTETVTIGAGGTAGVAGGNTTFGSWLTAYGGGAGVSIGGGGGGTGSIGSNGGNGGNPRPSGLGVDKIGGGGGDGSSGANGGNAEYGGGAGGAVNGSGVGKAGGSSIFTAGGGGGGGGSSSTGGAGGAYGSYSAGGGGAGGAASGAGTAGGSSTAGAGNGGGGGGGGAVGFTNGGNGGAGGTPGGGGGGGGQGDANGTGGAGGRGECRAWSY